MIRRLRHVPPPELAAAGLSVAVAVVLLAVKFTAYYLTGSAAIFSDAIESIVNVLASIFAAYSLFLAHQPADLQHPYGHGKIEFMSAGFEGGMIMLAAILIVVRAVEAVIGGGEVHALDTGLMLITIAGLINGGVGLYLIRAGRKHGSVTLTADGKHLLTDAITSIAVIVALLLVKWTGWQWIDPAAAFLVAAYIAWMAWQLLHESASGLMDRQDVEDEKLLHGLLKAHIGASAKEPRICSYHKLRHRHSGRFHWVDFHVVVPATWDVTHGHDVASALEHEIELSLGEGKATAHIEPCIDVTCAACAK